MLSTGMDSESWLDFDTVEKRVHMESANPSVGNAASARTLQDGLVHEYRTPLYALLAATSCVLLIACLNVANLLVARASLRRKNKDRSNQGLRCAVPIVASALTRAA